VTELGAKVDPVTDRVTVDGRVVSLATGNVYIALNKPPGYITTMSDPQGRPTVAGLVPTDEHPGLFPVGRLDADTTGLLLFTTDGELSHRLLHPRWKVPKTYLVLADGHLGPAALDALAGGILLDDGMTAPAQVRPLGVRGATSVVEITISEGRKRQVRRMFSAVGHPVLELDRKRFGPVDAAELELGEWRELASHEVEALKSAVELGSEGSAWPVS
jgi:23S rRNA pseudouridine2605 synthase